MDDVPRAALSPSAEPGETSTMPASLPPNAHGADEWYQVLIPEYDKVAYDPLDPPKRYHTGVFIETDPEHFKGTQFHVTGDVIAASGMRYEVKSNYSPKESKFFYRITAIGWIRKENFPRIKDILKTLPKPTKQQGLDFWSKDPTKRNKLTWTKENGELYGPDEERRPIMKCNEWTHDLAIPKLRSEGILHDSIQV